jgi:hypothetical protein
LTFEGYAQLVKTTIESNKKLEETPLDEKE